MPPPPPPKVPNPRSTHPPPPSPALRHFHEHLAPLLPPRGRLLHPRRGISATTSSAMADRDASAAASVRDEAREALKLHHAYHFTESLARAGELARAHPGSAVAQNIAGLLHQHAGIVAWTRRKPGDEKAAAAEARAHHRSALNAYSTAARLAPDCVTTAISHGEALASCQRFVEACAELSRALVLTETNYADPAEHNVGYDLFCSSTEEVRKENVVPKAQLAMNRFVDMIMKEFIPREVVEVLNANKLGGRAAAHARERAKLLSVSYPFSGHAQLFRAYVDLQQVRALDLAIDKTRLLRRTLSMTSVAAGNFDRSLVIALFHAKLLFVLDEHDAAESECRRALGIKWPTDPRDHAIPPGSVIGADYRHRVSSVRKQLQILLKQIIFVAALHWRSMISAQQDESIISVRVDTLHEHYNTIDQSAAKTISDARRFVKNHNSWSFWICPHCDGKKFVDADTLWQHVCSKHRDELWEKLQSVLGTKLCENTLKDDYSLDGITLCQDSGQYDIFRLPTIQDMFESLLLRPSTGIQVEPFAEIRQRKCREGSEILEGIKEKLRMLPADIISTEFEECRFAIQNLWLKFLEITVLDYRDVIIPLVRSFQWIEIKRHMSHSVNVAGSSIGDANIDAVFGRVSGAPDRNVSMDHLSQKSSDPPIDVDENRMKLAARISNVELDKKGTSGQSVEEMASTSSYQQSVNVFNENNPDKVLFILRVIIQSFCNLRHFRNEFLMRPLVWLPSADNPCIADIFYEIFSAWEKNQRHLPAVLLTSVKTILCRIIGDSNIFEKVGKNLASEIVAAILVGLHMSETSSHVRFNTETERQVVNLITSGDCICPTHNLFGIKFEAQMSCRCGKCSDEFLYTTLFHKLDVGSPQATKIKSFAELPVLLDEQFCKDNNCEHCGNLQNIDLFLSNTPHFLTIVLNWLGGSESQDTLSEVLAGITAPLDTEFFCRSAHSATKYSVASMVIRKGGEIDELFGIEISPLLICYADESYVCFARNKDKWLMYDSKTVKREDTWEHMLERFRAGKLQPEVLFFEVIK